LRQKGMLIVLVVDAAAILVAWAPALLKRGGAACKSALGRPEPPATGLSGTWGGG